MSEIRAIRDHLLADIMPGILHELNNPLGAIIMNVSIVREDLAVWKSEGTLPEMDMLVETCQDMDTASERINQILQAVSYFSGGRFLEEGAGFNALQLVRFSLTLYHNRLKRAFRVTPVIPEDRYHFVNVPPAVGILSILLGLETLLQSGGDREASLMFQEDKNRLKMVFRRPGMKIGKMDQRLVALARQSDIELGAEDQELSLAFVSHDPDSMLSNP